MDTAFSPELVWLLMAACLVLLMTPGVAFFYGGLTRAKSALNMIMMSVISMGIVAVVWVLWAYALAGGGNSVAGIIGNPFDPPYALGLQNLIGSPELINAGYAGTFAVLTVALISGAIADRTRFGAWMIFVPLWVTLVYAPLSFMVWGEGGLMLDGAIADALGGPAIDFAGGTVVHVNAGVAALVLALIIGRRYGFRSERFHRPHNVPLVMLGTALLWFGWFGFNAGLAADAAQGGLIWINTLVAPAAGMLGYSIIEKVRDAKVTPTGAAAGVIAGLVAVTPACANLEPWAAMLLGLIAGLAAAFAIGLKYRLGYDDSLDVVGVHLVAGIIGTVFVGLFAAPVTADAPRGLFYGGGVNQLVIQVVAAAIAIAFTGVLTFIIGSLINATIGFRVPPEVENRGVDISLHDELAYEFLSEHPSPAETASENIPAKARNR